MRPSSTRNFQPTENATPADQPLDDEPHEECGVFGVWAPGEDVAKLTYYGLYALQHRGQEAAGIAVSDGRRIVVFKDLGLVSQVFDEQVLSSLRGHLAVGHCRYSTTGSTTWENAQPTFRTTAAGSGVALGHNGNLVNTAELRDEVLRGARRGRRPGDRKAVRSTTDSDLVTELLAATAADTGLEEAALRLLPRLRGAFSLVFSDEQTLYAARDRHGVRPAGAGPAGARLGGGQRDRRAGHRRCVDRPRGRAGRADRHRRGRHAQLAVRRTGAQGLRVRVRLPGPAGHLDLRPVGARGPGGDRAPAGPGAPGRGRPGDPHPGVRHPGRDRLRPGLRHPVRPGPGQERLRRAHLHPAVADHPPAGDPAQAEPAARRHPGQAAGRRRRLDRARQHPAGAGPDAARGRRARGARPDRLAAGALAVLLRHRLRHPGRAGGRRAGRRGSAPLHRRRHPRLRLAGRADRGQRAAAHPAVHGLLRRGLPDPAARGGAAGQAPAGGARRARATTTGRWATPCPARSPGDAGPVRSGPADRPSALLAVGYGAEDALRRP